MGNKRQQVRTFNIQDIGTGRSVMVKDIAIGMSIREMKNSRILEAMSESSNRERKNREVKALSLISMKEK